MKAPRCGNLINFRLLSDLCFLIFHRRLGIREAEGSPRATCEDDLACLLRPQPSLPPSLYFASMPPTTASAAANCYVCQRAFFFPPPHRLRFLNNGRRDVTERERERERGEVDRHRWHCGFCSVCLFLQRARTKTRKLFRLFENRRRRQMYRPLKKTNAVTRERRETDIKRHIGYKASERIGDNLDFPFVTRKIY